jgi:hypothetical protein
MHTCCAHYPGGSKRVHMSIASPFHAAFPELWAGRHPQCPFRGLLRLRSRYGPHACSTTQGGLYDEASTEPVARPRRPLATSSIDNSLGGTLLHKCFAQSRRTRVSRHCRQREHFEITTTVIPRRGTGSGHRLHLGLARQHRRDGSNFRHSERGGFCGFKQFKC